MTSIQRAMLLTGAVVTMTAALVLLSTTGLPNRAAFSGLGVDENDRSIAPEVDAVAPSFTQATLQGESIQLTDLRGSPVLINFWATWCAPCRIEMPYLQMLYDEYQGDGLRILAVNMGESPEAVVRWVEENALTFDIVLDEENRISDLYQLRGQPSTYVIGPEGVISEIFFGPVDEDTLRNAIAPYLS
ncbi:MAG: TlpA family protein disulfide reductase [Chloroflexi bacterium]|nr:MAG: hypothetical protein CUN54_07040 [Phototrophicales bacterium]RMF78953.1 MAG: TlpA family protein disulfide reductase [Chloroflexota bacterium]